MSNPAEILSDSPADFDSSFAYALHSEMRRLLIVAIIGSFLLPIGLGMFLNQTFFFEDVGRIVRLVLGLGIALVGYGFLFGGLIGALFKLVTDANIVAAAANEE